MRATHEETTERRLVLGSAALLLVIVVVLLAVTVNKARADPCEPRIKHGIASYYWPEIGKRWSHHVAEGGYYDPSELTAAHRTLPFGTRVKVIDPKANRYIIVRISDRGPFIKGRIIDLTPYGARLLGFAAWTDNPVEIKNEKGILQVKIEVLNPRTRKPSKCR